MNFVMQIIMPLWFIIFPFCQHSRSFLGVHFGGVAVEMSNSVEDENIGHDQDGLVFHWCHLFSREMLKFEVLMACR
jgi:hypothetical protein